MCVCQPRGKLASSSSGCQSILLPSSAYGERKQFRGFDEAGSFLGQVSLSERSLLLFCLRFASAPLISCLFFSICCCCSQLFEGHVSLAPSSFPSLTSAISSSSTSLRISWAKQGIVEAASRFKMRSQVRGLPIVHLQRQFQQEGRRLCSAHERLCLSI